MSRYRDKMYFLYGTSLVMDFFRNSNCSCMFSSTLLTSFSALFKRTSKSWRLWKFFSSSNIAILEKWSSSAMGPGLVSDFARVLFSESMRLASLWERVSLSGSFSLKTKEIACLVFVWMVRTCSTYEINIWSTSFKMDSRAVFIIREVSLMFCRCFCSYLLMALREMTFLRDVKCEIFCFYQDYQDQILVVLCSLRMRVQTTCLKGF